jgi:hypothetical protein
MIGHVALEAREFLALKRCTQDGAGAAVEVAAISRYIAGFRAPARDGDMRKRGQLPRQ